jgi:hypothetical protein
MLDNAMNNDTFVDGIERRAKKAGVPFNASWARLRCMPHTIHLAAIKVCFSTMSMSMAHSVPVLKLLEGIGAVSRAEGKKAASRAGNYQDTATASLDRSLDNSATTLDDPVGSDISGDILSSVDKVPPY